MSHSRWGTEPGPALSIFPFLQQGVPAPSGLVSLPESYTCMSGSQPALRRQRQEFTLWLERLRPRLEAEGFMEAIVRPSVPCWWLKELGEKLETR